MKICLLGNAQSIHCVRWANALNRRGHNIYFISLSRPTIHLLDSSVNVEILPFDPPFGYFLSFPKAKLIIKRIKPDILNTHYASGYGTLSRFINFHPTLLSVWGSDVFDVPYQSKYMFKLIRKNLMAATRLASTSKIMKSQINKFFKSNDDIFITPFGVDLDLFKPMTDKDDAVITIGMVKSLEEKYGPKYLVKAFKIVLDKLYKEGPSELAKQLRLLIVGNGPQRREIDELINQLSINEVTEMPGEISHSMVLQYLNRMDIFCLPSIIQESFGVAAIEASACEIPVIASNIGGLPEVVVDGETGLLFEPKNVFALADKIFQLVLNPELRKKMGKNGRRFITENYNWDENVLRMEQFYYQIIGKKA